MIHMEKNSAKSKIDFNKYSISYQAGTAEALNNMQQLPILEPFSEKTVEFLNAVSKALLSDREAKNYPDVITFAFWIRKSSIEGIKKRFSDEDKRVYRLGRGIVFHIAPSNVPVNYAYSLVTGLICGNANVVRIPSKEFPQVNIINNAINNILKQYRELEPYIVLVRYGHDSEINDALSEAADVRVIWGGDETISTFRKSPLKPRATEITFANRYSLAVIDSDKYMEIEDKTKAANDFYNDTYLMDQNACTSPRIVVWTGSKITAAKKIFWEKLHDIAESRYEINGVQAVNKLASGYLLAAVSDNVKRENDKDNLLVRIKVDKVSAGLMDFKDNSGYFFEYDCKDILEIKDLCNDDRCQTVSYIGEKEMFIPLIKSGIKGIDRVVKVGKSMNFDLIWDGYNLFERMTRAVVL